MARRVSYVTRFLSTVLACLLIALLPTTAAEAAGRLALHTRSSALGTIVTGASGRTVYVFDLDHQGTRRSACTGACRRVWPLVTFRGTARTHVSVSGVTGKVSSIPVRPGVRQVTLNGWPLYYYAGDAAPGDVSGEGSGGTWWVVAPSGTRIQHTGPSVW